MLNQISVLAILFFCWFNLNAQRVNNVALNLETGLLWDWVDGTIYLSGPFLNVEPKLKTSKNTVIGLRLGAARTTQRMVDADADQFIIDNYGEGGNSIFSLVPTFDYYFKVDGFRPFLGLGFGYFFLTTSKAVFAKNNLIEELEVSVENQVGWLLRGGAHLPKFKIGNLDLSTLVIGLTYHYIPKADVKSSTEQVVGILDNSHIALSIGYLVGHRKS